MNFNSPLHKKLVTYLPKKVEKLNIVDYGCGEGELLHYMDLNRIKNYFGFDINQGSIQSAQAFWRTRKKVKFSLINKKKLPSLGKPSSVDVIFLIGVVQYLPKKDLDHVLREAQKVLKKDGVIIISSTNDHLLYKIFNIYRLFLTPNVVNIPKLHRKIREHKLSIYFQSEKGLVLTPLFSNVLVFFFDAFDKLLFKTKGTIGPAGTLSRTLFSPLTLLEFSLPINYGYTTFTLVVKEKSNYSVLKGSFLNTNFSK